jgi:hypothetical protein
MLGSPIVLGLFAALRRGKRRGERIVARALHRIDRRRRRDVPT